MIGVCFEGLKTYGKKPEHMASTIALFRMVLADYEVDKVRVAFAVYLKRHSDMPAPSDIVQIIERDGKPPFDRSVYVTISKKDPADRTQSEWSYMRDYERYARSGEMA